MITKSAELNGVKILNLSHIDLDEERFFTILMSSMNKDPYTSGNKRDPLIWIMSKPHNREIFRMIEPLLSPGFSKNQRDIFIREGALLFRGSGKGCMEAIICKRTDIKSKRSVFLDLSYDFE